MVTRICTVPELQVWQSQAHKIKCVKKFL